jgi:hypothetical protein
MRNLFLNFVLVALSILGCKSQLTKLKFPAFDNNNCAVFLPLNEKYKGSIKDDGHDFFIEKSDFKDSLYVLYLPQSNLPSLYISYGTINHKRTPTIIDYSKAIIQRHNNSFQKVKDVNFSIIENKSVGEISKVTYKFVYTDLYNINYSFFVGGNVITIGCSYINDKSPKRS